MSNQKSYMNDKNSIITEGALGVLTGLIAAGHITKFLKFLKKNSTKMRADIKNLNKQVDKLEKDFEK